MTCGIYALNFTGTNKLYIGKSKNIERRYSGHTCCLRAGKHSAKLLEAYELYGMPYHTVIETCTEDQLDLREEYYIELNNTVNNGLNSRKKAYGGNGTYGESAYNSNYLDIEVVELVKYIAEHPMEPLISVSSTLNIDYKFILKVASGCGSLWVKDVLPLEYNKMLSKVGDRNKGENAPNAGYKNSLIEKVFIHLLLGTSVQDVSLLTGVSYSVVHSIKSGRNHTWLKDIYPIEYKELMSTNIIQNNSIIVIDTSNNEHEVVNRKEFAKIHGLSYTSLCKLINGVQKTHKGWTLKTWCNN